jgi:hypothetical protein
MNVEERNQLYKVTQGCRLLIQQERAKFHVAITSGGAVV